MIPAKLLHKAPPAVPISTMDPHYPQSQIPQNSIVCSESPLPAGFINPFASQNAQLLPAAEGASASVEAHPGLAEISTALSASMSIQALQPFSQERVQAQLNLPRQRQSFDIAMLPPHTTSQRQSLDQQNDITFAKPSSIGLSNSSMKGRSNLAFRLQDTHIPQPIQHDLSLSQASEQSNRASTSARQSRESPSLDSSRGSTSIMSIGNTGISDIALLLSGAIKLKAHTSGKPPYSYATLITYAIMKHPRKQMTLNEIYTWVMERYPYFKTAGSGWKNSIRHNLSLSKTFVRIPRPINEPGKGAYWTVDLAVLDATMSNQLKPPAHRLPPTREQQLYGASGNNVGIQRYPLAPPGISALSTQSVSSGSFAPGSFAMGMTSSISEMGLVQNAPLPGSSLALRRASLQALPTHGRYQPYPTPTSMGLSGNRPQYPSIDPSSSYAQQILSNFNPFALPMTANIYNGTNGRLQARNPAALSDVSANMGPQSVFPMITTAISSSSIHGPSADVDTQLGKPNAAILRQDSKVAASNIDNYPFVPAPGNPKSQGPTQFNNKLRDDTWLKQQESVRGEAEFTNLTALPTQAYPQVKATPSLPDYLLTSQNTIPGEIHGQKPYRQPNKMDGASDKTVCAEASAQDETTQPQNHANETTSITNNNMTGNDLSAYFTFSET